MILVHRLKGEPFVVNADLIETVEAFPDTVLRLVDGRKAVVSETPEEVVDLVVAFRAAIVRAADELRDGDDDRRRPNLSVLPAPEDDAT